MTSFLRSGVAVLFLAMLGCRERPSEPTPVAKHSPFAVRIQGLEEYDVITFKQVSGPAVDGRDLEALAEALALEFERDRLNARVAYDPAMLDASRHHHCDQGHIYVDFWVSDGRVGYSLWSGCGESDRFATEEIELTSREPDPLMLKLADRIVRQLRAARGTGCYRSVC